MVAALALAAGLGLALILRRPVAAQGPARPEGRTAPPEGRPVIDEPVASLSVEVPILPCRPIRSEPIAEGDEYAVPRPPFSEGVFPCTRCHDRPDDVNPTPRKLTVDHTQIRLAHGPREQWCYGCHNPPDRDKLRLAGGRLLELGESYLLCGQCHGPKLRDWRLGIHGRRTGCWNGPREYRLCVHCHDPHAPRFKPIAPEPPPRRPAQRGPRRSGHGSR
jgi:hypothetical protein